MKYPIYIPSKGREDNQKTVKLLLSHGINNFYVVVESNEYLEYGKHVPYKNILRMRSSNYGTSTNARNFCIEHSIKKGFKKHWQLDDDINKVFRHSRPKIVHDDLKLIFNELEDISDSTPLVGIVGMYTNNFLCDITKPIQYNTSVTSLFLITNYNIRFRGTMYVDIDYQLQLLKKGLRTVKCQDYAFVFQTPLKHKGGYYDIYKDDKKRTEANNEFLRLNPDIKCEIHRNAQGYLALKGLRTIWRKYQK